MYAGYLVGHCSRKFLKETSQEILRNKKEPTGGNNLSLEKMTKESIFQV